MKNIKTLLSAVAFAATLLLSGCEEPKEVVEEPQLTIETSATVPCQGGTIELDYTIANPVADATLTASEPSAEWIESITIGEQKVTITTAHNLAKGATSREASFKLLYNSKEMAEIIILQEAMTGSLDITILNITPESVSVEITSTDDQMGWMCNFAPIAYVEEMGGIDEYVLLDADAYRNSFYGDLLDEYIFTGSTTKTHILKNPPLEPMYVWVVGISRATDAARTPIVTFAPVTEEFSFLPIPTITLEAEGAEPFDTNEGSHTISYTLENPVKGGKVVAEAIDGAENWVNNIVVDEQACTISFTYDANTLAIERTGAISVGYDYAEDAIYTISQAPNTASERITFDFAIKEIHHNRVIVDCTPSDNSVKYAIGAIAKCDFEGYNYEGDPTKIPEMDLKATYPTHTITTGAVADFTIEVIYNSDSEWYIYAYAVNDAESIATSAVEMVAVTLVDDRPEFTWADSRVSGTTLSVPATEGTYTIAYSITNPIEGGVVKVEEPYDDMLTKTDGKRVQLDQQAQTITFTVSANTTKKSRTTYVYLKYFSSENDSSSDANISLKISQSK